MVTKRSLAIAVFAVFVLFVFVSSANAQRTYVLNQEWVQVWINQDTSIDLFYNVSITLVSGDKISWVLIGQPRGGFTITSAYDQYGHNLTAVDVSSGSDFKVNITLSTPLFAEQTVWFTLMTNVPHMIWEDTKNAGNVGMQFTPTWWTEAVVYDLRILVVLPPDVPLSQVKTTEVLWNGTSFVEGRNATYWEKTNLPVGRQYPVGVSFPKQYVQKYDTQPTGLVAFFQQYGTALLVGASFLIIIGAIVVIARKKSYQLPKMSMETLGIRRGLTAVEASYLLDLPPAKIVTEILYSLLKKRAVWVESVTPSVKLKVIQKLEGGDGTPEPAESALRYYEIDFLGAVRTDGRLDEEKLAKTVMYVRDAVEEKLRGFCRRDTVDYYRSIADKAWEQVQQAGTPELASKVFDEQLLWLLLHPDYQARAKTAFRDRVFEPSPFWFWYWYGYRHYDPHPTYQPNVQAPAQSAKPPTIPGADFANNIATAVENTSNNIVVNLEKFANAILPMPAAKASNQPAHHDANCVCACASCACVCACVSCACACAGGGVG